MALVLRRGRVLNASDSADPRRAALAVINEAMRERFWPGTRTRWASGWRSASVGSGSDRPNTPPRLDFESAAREIVGVVADVRASAIADPALPAMYVPFAQRPVFNLTLGGAHGGNPVWSINPIGGGACARSRPAGVVGSGHVDIVAASVQQPRDRTTLIGVFALVALLLAAIGVYG